MSMQLVVAPKNLTLKECGLTRAQVKSAEFPAKYREMVKAMKRVDSIDECRTISAESDAMAIYFKQLNDPEPAALALSIKARAYRRIGELLNKGARSKTVSVGGTVGRLATSIARIPEEEFEAELSKRPVPGIGTLSQKQLRKERGNLEDLQESKPRDTRQVFEDVRANRLSDLRAVVRDVKTITQSTSVQRYAKQTLEIVPFTPSEKSCVIALAEDLIEYGEYLIAACNPHAKERFKK